MADKHKLIKKKKVGTTIRESAADKAVRGVALGMTIFWLFMLFFPIYWLVITSFKDSADAFLDPPSFVPTTSLDYNIVLEYDREEWDSMTEEEFENEMNKATWMSYRNIGAIRLGRMKAWCMVDGEVVGSGELLKSSYALNNQKVSSTTEDYTVEIIEGAQEVITETKSVKYNTLQKLPVAEKQLQDKYSKEMLEYWQTEESVLIGQVTDSFYNKNWKNFVLNYICAWDYPISQGLEDGLWQATFNSLRITILAVLGEWLICGLAGYAVSKLMRPRTGRRVLLFFITTTMIPSTVTIVASYLLLQNIGAADNFWGVVLPTTCSASSILLFKGNFDSVSMETVEAARIDGASEMQIFLRIMLPLSKPIFATIGMFEFMSTWGEFFWSNIILRDRNQFTIPLVMNILFKGSGATANYPMMMALSLIISIPTMIIVIFGQKYLSQGMVYTGLKG